MQKFRFPLESAMQYRQLQIDMQRGRIESLLSQLRSLDAEKRKLLDEKEFADCMVKGVDPQFSLSLMALDSFCRRSTLQETALERKRSECFRLIAQQQTALIDAKRNYELLKGLREKKLATWKNAFNSEQEQTSSNAHMAKVVRENAATRRTPDTPRPGTYKH